MSSPPDPQTEIQALIEGDLSPERFEALQQRLRKDPAFLQEYLRAVRVHHLLEARNWEAGSTGTASPMMIGLVRWGMVGAAVAAAFLLLATWVRPGPGPSGSGEPTFPDFRFAAHALFEAEVPEDRAGGRILEGDAVAMREGYVSIRLVSGAEAVIESPSNFAIVGPNRLRLDHGNATFRVPDSATGFTVQLPWMEVVDLGTVFSASAEAEANQVYVEQGSVEVYHDALLEQPQLLLEGETLTCYRNESIEIEADSSLVHLREQTESTVVFHDLLAYAPDQRLADRAPLAGEWTVQQGEPWIREGRLNTQGRDTEAFGHFTQELSVGAGVVLLSLRARAPESLFHSKGWAGISFFDQDREVFFFGDKSNDSYSWNFIPYGETWQPGMQEVPTHDLQIQGGEATFTIRYHQATGMVEIFQGWGVIGAPVVEFTTDPGLRFDRLRVANADGGDFSFEEVQVTLLR